MLLSRNFCFLENCRQQHLSIVALLVFSDLLGYILIFCWEEMKQLSLATI
ncbi:unnamed protein product [Enterobius vermicularis]|uniref:G_PROTEIN_RECEP_F1_2 domain-containing protein n=1 Tax=Enterobius vermicularis TaxID=51028 RepID=A0A0N4V6I8_ENTVE|nr:unnamed protein product [Enterobius vermicularis]